MAGPAWSTMIDARPMRFPVHCPDLSAAVLYYDAPVATMSPWVEGTGLRLVEHAPGRTEVAVSVTRYAGWDWGTLEAFDVVLDVVPSGRTGPEWAGLYFLDTVVNQRFTTEVSYWVLGIDRRYGSIVATRSTDDITYEVAEDGRHLVTLALPRRSTGRPQLRRPTRIYTHLADELHVTPIDLDLPARSADTGAVTLEVGAGRLERLLADVGVPGAPMAYSWDEHLTCTIHEPRPVLPTDGPGPGPGA